MTLSILCVTNGEPHAAQFLMRMQRLASVLGCEFVIGIDGPARDSQLGEFGTRSIKLPDHTVPLQEMVSDIAVNECKGRYVLRLDDDEAVSPALEKWLLKKGYEGGSLFAFPRVYLYPDAGHVLANDGIYPDLQTRLGLRENMFGVDHIHAGNRHGTGAVIPYAIEHHSLIVKSHEQRLAIADRYEAIRPGAGKSNTYGRYLIPEDIYGELVTKEYADGDYSA